VLARRFEAGPHRLGVGHAVRGEGEQRLPELREAIQVGVAVLADQRGDPSRSLAGDPQADRGAVVLHVQREPVEAELVEQLAGDGGQRVERVLELVHRRGGRTPEPEVVGGDQVVRVGQLGDQLAVHERAGRKAVQQHQRRARRVAGRPVEDLVPEHRRGAVAGRKRRHRELLWLKGRGERSFSAR
jgi:hypothetical protein